MDGVWRMLAEASTVEAEIGEAFASIRSFITETVAGAYFALLVIVVGIYLAQRWLFYAAFSDRSGGTKDDGVSF